MNGQAPQVVYYALLIVLVASSLVGMRQPIGKTLKMALAWVAIFGGAFVLLAFRSEFSELGSRLRAEATGSPLVEGEALRIPIGQDGHFWVEAKLNGHDVRFMVDSGATVTTVSRDTAEEAALAIGSDRTRVSTANGTVWMARGRAERLEVGPIERTDFAVDINENDETNLLGMNFLSSLGSWRVQGNYLVLQP